MFAPALKPHLSAEEKLSTAETCTDLTPVLEMS